MKKVLLLILDGLGYSEEKKGNAVMAAEMPFYNSLLKSCPNTLLEASSTYVGLPEGIMGNSEVGHENIGAGRIVKQKLTMISDMLKTGEFFENEVLKAAVAHALKHESKLHLMGLISEGDVHSHLGHLDGLIELADKANLKKDKVFLHAISDGRDDPPYVAEHLMKRYEEKLSIATVSGRYWAMDRDSNWDRVEKYYQCVVNASGEEASSASEAIRAGYELAKARKNPAGDSDEFILPTVIDKDGLIEANDAVIFFNFRPDRARQISQKLGLESKIENLHYVCFTDYSAELETQLPVAFAAASLPKQDKSMALGEYLSSLSKKQFRIAETEKFNHVTSFFNQGYKEPYPGEDRLLIPSPKVATYDLQPQMSLYEVTEGLLDAMSKTDEKAQAFYDLIVCNFANPDMVGHTGKWDAVLTALNHVDKCLEQVINKAKEKDYIVFVTADHGNADQMLDLSTNGEDEVRTAHSCNPVPFIMVNGPETSQFKDLKLKALSNIAPTLLKCLDLAKPKQMTAESLL